MDYQIISWFLFPPQHDSIVTEHDKLKRKPIDILRSQTSQRDCLSRTYLFGARRL